MSCELHQMIMYIIHHTFEGVQEKHLTMQYSPLTPHNQVSYIIQKRMFFYKKESFNCHLNNSTNISKTNELPTLTSNNGTQTLPRHNNVFAWDMHEKMRSHRYLGSKPAPLTFGCSMIQHKCNHTP